jgi:hypothetical protein
MINKLIIWHNFIHMFIQDLLMKSIDIFNLPNFSIDRLNTLKQSIPNNFISKDIPHLLLLFLMFETQQDRSSNNDRMLINSINPILFRSQLWLVHSFTTRINVLINRSTHHICTTLIDILNHHPSSTCTLSTYLLFF